MGRDDIKSDVIDILSKWSGDDISFFDEHVCEVDLDCIIDYSEGDNECHEIYSLLNNHFKLSGLLEHKPGYNIGKVSDIVDGIYKLLENKK
jgi:hypothetical protein